MTTADDRPNGVPASTSPAESPHGIVWIDCAAAGSGRDRFGCSVHLGETGELWSEGEYVLRREDSDGFSPLDVFPGQLNYLSWDREVIRADGNLALLPDGLIEFPVDENVGIKQLYVEGKEVGEPIPFERQD